MSLRVLFVFLGLGLAPGVACAAPFHPETTGLFGEMWDVSSAKSLTEARAAIDGVAATATFRATALDYPSGAKTLSSMKRLSDFLGADSTSLEGPDARMTTSVFRFSGFLDVAAGEHALAIASDDGFGLWLDGALVASHEKQRALQSTGATLTVAQGGSLPFELIYFEHYGNAGLHVALDGATLGAERLSTQPAAIPLPMTGALLLTALGALAFARRRAA